MPKVVYRYANKCFFGNLRVEDKFGRRRPMFLPIYHGQTHCRISIERLAMGKGSLICVPSLRRLYLPGASFKLGFMPVSPRSTAKLWLFRAFGDEISSAE